METSFRVAVRNSPAPNVLEFDRLDRNANLPTEAPCAPCNRTYIPITAKAKTAASVSSKRQDFTSTANPASTKIATGRSRHGAFRPEHLIGIDRRATGIGPARAQGRRNRPEHTKKTRVKRCVPNLPYADNEVKSCLPHRIRQNNQTTGRSRHRNRNSPPETQPIFPQSLVLRHSVGRHQARLRRAASHAATAAAVHWGNSYNTRRRLTIALMNAMFTTGISWASLVRTFRGVHTLTPAWIASVGPRAARLATLRSYRRARRLVADVNRAIDSYPNPLGIAQEQVG